MPEEVEELEEDGEESGKEPGKIVPHEPITVALAYPIEHGERTIRELTFRPLTAKDMRRSSATLKTIVSQRTVLEYAGFLSGEPPHVIDKLMGCDAVAVIEAVSGFFMHSRQTGGKQLRA